MTLRYLFYLCAFYMFMTNSAHSAQPDCTAQPTNLASMRDCYRPILIFASSAADVRLAQQLAELHRHAADLKDRDILVTILLPDSEQPAAEDLSGLPSTRLETREAASLRMHYRVGKQDSLILLIGKDGGEKFRSSKLVSVNELNHIIDAMPMRQDEMHQK